MKNHKLLVLGLLLLLSSQVITSQTKKWYNPLHSLGGEVIHGRAWGAEIGDNYNRLPQRAKDSVRPELWNLSRQNAGLSLSFYANSPTITIRYKVSGSHAMAHMPTTGVTGVDLYTTDCDGKQYWCEGRFSFGDTIRYEYKGLSYHNTHDKGNEFQLYLPLYNTVTWLEIGIEDGTELEFIPISSEKPIVIYGTSIAQGACASRPGMAWGNIINRKLDSPVINLAFSGNGRLESELFDFLSEIESRLYIIDCMPNMTDDRTNMILDRTVSGVQKLRSKSDTPILLVAHCGYMGGFSADSLRVKYEQTNKELVKACKHLQTMGIRNIYYMSYAELGLSADSQVDGIHASDLGMQQYADAYETKIREILNLYSGQFVHTKSVKQRREPGSYEWNKRHEEILKYNKTEQPDIVMIGNSITHYWSGEPSASFKRGEQSWAKLFGKHKVVNMGFGWDRIENVLWRINHGELDGFSAKKVFVTIGTNNLERDTDQQIVEGINIILNSIRQRQPQADIYLVKILPRRGMEERIEKLNTVLDNSVSKTTNLHLIDVSQSLKLNAGKIDESMFSDGLHPNEKGYDKLASEMRKYVTK